MIGTIEKLYSLLKQRKNSQPLGRIFILAEEKRFGLVRYMET